MIAAELARFALAPIDAEAPVRHSARRHLLDGFGTALAARRRHAGEAAWRVAHQLGGPREALPIGGTTGLSAPAAAMASAVAIHALDFDDTHALALVHPTTISVPAALAVGQEQGRSWAEIVEAITIGLEIACRLGSASPHGFHERGLHATAVVGPIASAAVAARLMGLDHVQTADALGIAASSSGGLLEFLDTGADTKTLHPGSASLNGVIAARLAAAGASGPETALEGRRGLYATMSEHAAEPDSLVAGLGETWLAEGIGIKPYPCCQLIHVSLDAGARLVDDAAVDPDQIAQIVVDVHPDSLGIVGDVRPDGVPLSSYDAKFDLRWCLAVLLIEGAVTLDTYAPDMLGRADIAALAQRIELRPVPRPGPAAEASGRVELRLADGGSRLGEVPASRGTSSRPLDDEALIAKFTAGIGGEGRELAELVLAPHADTTPQAVLRQAAALADDRGGTPWTSS